MGAFGESTQFGEKKICGSLGEIVKNMGSLGESDAEKWGLNSLTYAPPPEWGPPPSRGKAINKLFFLLNEKANPA